jgi:hypothetical protein
MILSALVCPVLMSISEQHAAFQIDNATLNVDDLFTHLMRVAGEQDGSADHELSRPPAGSFESGESTPPPITIMAVEISSHHELIRDGDRPACSVEELTHILAEPMTRYKTILSWLSDDPDSRLQMER